MADVNGPDLAAEAEPHLFSDFMLRDVTFKNRTVASPMWQYCGKAGSPTSWHHMHLGRMASGGAGLVIQEATSIERRSCGTLGDLGIWDDRFVYELSGLAAGMRALGTVPGIQLVHTGRKARKRRPWEGRGALERRADIADWDDWELIAPSPIPETPESDTPREMTHEDISTVLDAWVAAARRADEAGYDVLEVHGAHGYLLHQFMSPAANRRTDRYGGSFENRVRFPLDVTAAVRAAWPQQKPLLMRLSCVDGEGWTLDNTIRLARELKLLGVDAIDCSSGGIGFYPLSSSRPLTYGYQVEYAETVRRKTGLPTMAVGLIVHAELADSIIRNRQADFVALGRELLYNPNWPMDAAQKLGVDPEYDLAPPNVGYWLKNRAASFGALEPSTWRGPVK
jgi:2,4-dienoyl-CoA reductase-like NADH-dependent reductase (Old Yellow Enzyme family)